MLHRGAINFLLVIGAILFCFLILDVFLYFIQKSDKSKTKYPDGLYINFVNPPHEDTADLIRGVYYPMDVKCQLLKLTNNKVDYSGLYIQKNHEGFADQDDFLPKKSVSEKRIAVFGDSFTAGNPLVMNWPDRVERISSLPRQKFQLNNYSIDGAGIANWWSIFTRYIDWKATDFNLIIFAVYGNDLYRNMTYWEFNNVSQIKMSREKSWDPLGWAKNISDIEWVNIDGYILSKEKFLSVNNSVRFLEREYKAPLSYHFLEELVIQSRYRIREMMKKNHKENIESGYLFNENQLIFFRDIKKIAKERHIPIMVVWIPSLDELTKNQGPPDDVLTFSKLIDADFISGAEAFRDVFNLRWYFNPYDPHWNQRGSDLFAKYLYKIILENPAINTD